MGCYRMNTIQVGDIGEKAAANYLCNNGYQILERKYRRKIGEIDIIAKNNQTLVFVEVKTRSSSRYGSPAEAVNYHKQQKIMNTALCYLKQMNQDDARCRFDVMEIFLTDLNVVKCNHIINAFSK